jgi:peptidoglycan/xylan/chitin deacetylase (PgdA/CDA1 family)
LHFYYGVQYPYRRWLDARRAAAGRAPIMVLGYHRIADDQATPWTQTNRSFARQMAWLRQHFDMISLGEAQRRLRSGRNHRAAVSITFDDGYAANCVSALPLLLREGIPCTYFVSTRNVLEGRPFDHDLALGHSLPPNTVDELRALAEAGVEIGVHTRTHADLGPIMDPTQLHDEVVFAGVELAEAIDWPVRYFAFPFGKHANLNPAAFAMGKEYGYEAMCSAYGGFNFPGDDPFHLQRIMVDELTIRLKNWVTVDPRKLRSVHRFEYESAAVDCLEAAGADAV